MGLKGKHGVRDIAWVKVRERGPFWQRVLAWENWLRATHTGLGTQKK
jgi:hypothetical protein